MKIFIIIIFIFFGFNIVFAQNDCPPTINDSDWEEGTGITFEPIPMDVWGRVDAKYREISNGQYEVKIDWNTLSNNHRYGITDNEFKQMMYKAVMTAIAGDNNLCGENPGTLLFVFYEETHCKLTKHCNLKVDYNQEVLCEDSGWPGPDPVFFEYQNEKYYRTYTQIDCGLQCCKYNYTVECVFDAGGNFKYLHILTQGKTPYPGSECDQTIYQDCLTGEPENCQSTCQ